MPAEKSEHGVDEELYQLLVESVLDYAIFALDPEGRIATWNKGAERFKGYKADEIIGKHFSVFYPEEDRRAKKPERELEIAKKTGRVEDEGWRIRKDGSRFWANVVITALRDEQNKLVGFAKVTRDLTKRREAEEQAQLLAAESAARSTSEQLNEELKRLNHELQQQALEAEAMAEHAQDLAQELEQANQQLEETVAEMEESRDAVRTGARRVRFLVEASDALAASTDYERSLQNLADAVVPYLADWCVVEIVEDGHARQTAVAHTDPAKLHLAKELSERYPPSPEDQAGAVNVMRTGQPELYPQVTEDMITRSAHDEKHREILRALQLKSVMILPLAARGRTLGTMTLASAKSGRSFTQDDVTFAMELARRAAVSVDNARLHTEAVEARRDAERAADAKTRFLAVMSHELRTPLNAIGGYAELISMGLRGPVTEQQKDDLARIVRNQVSLQSLINDVLDYAKLESGTISLRPRLVSVRSEVEEVEALVGPQLQAKNLRYDYQACDSDLEVCAEPRSLRQILLNLLSNAIKFTNSGGKITLACQTTADAVEIRVTDTGKGIPAENLDTIFEPFVQLDRDSSHPQEGTGLGLSISRDLARTMKGDLTVESKVGDGSTFIITLPRAHGSESCG